MKESNVNIFIGEYIRKSRKEKGLSGSELAKKLYISQQQISRYERGTNNVTLEMYIKIIKAMDIDPHEATNKLVSFLKEEFCLIYFE